MNRKYFGGYPKSKSQIELESAKKLVAQMLEAWEEQFGEGSCDCMPEPHNQPNICPWCSARVLLGKLQPGD